MILADQCLVKVKICLHQHIPGHKRNVNKCKFLPAKAYFFKARNFSIFFDSNASKYFTLNFVSKDQWLRKDLKGS